MKYRRKTRELNTTQRKTTKTSNQSCTRNITSKHEYTSVDNPISLRTSLLFLYSHSQIDKINDINHGREV